MLHKELVTDARRVAYDFDQQRGWLLQASGTCCDMTGCIALFKRIDPNVKIIETFSGRRADVRYVKQDGKWRAQPGGPNAAGR